MSIEVDCYTKAELGRIFDLVSDLGGNLGYHHRFGLYLDAISPEFPGLPDCWQERLIKVQCARMRAWFLEPNDAAFSKYALGSRGIGARLRRAFLPASSPCRF